MSNYHYNDQRGCRGCLENGDYSDLQNTTHFSCDQKCLCRFNDDRSTKDKMYYNWFVLNKTITIPPVEQEKTMQKIISHSFNK